jgi:hypothetical protein
MRPHRYRIIVSGRLGAITREVFGDLCVESDGANTRLTGELDQAALYGVLNRIQDFGLELLALSRLDDQQAEIEEPEACRPRGDRQAPADQAVISRLRSALTWRNEIGRRVSGRVWGVSEACQGRCR